MNTLAGNGHRVDLDLDRLVSPVIFKSHEFQRLHSQYCKTLNICGIKFSRFNENNILEYFNFGGHDIPWLQIVKKT